MKVWAFNEALSKEEIRRIYEWAKLLVGQNG